MMAVAQVTGEGSPEPTPASPLKMTPAVRTVSPMHNVEINFVEERRVTQFGEESGLEKDLISSCDCSRSLLRGVNNLNNDVA